MKSIGSVVYAFPARLLLLLVSENTERRSSQQQQEEAKGGTNMPKVKIKDLKKAGKKTAERVSGGVGIPTYLHKSGTSLPRGEWRKKTKGFAPINVKQGNGKGFETNSDH